MDSQNGWQIVERCRQAPDDAAWRAFVERFETPMVWGIQRALNSLGFNGARSEVVADLLQETYCRILSRERRTLRLCRESDERALDAYFARVAERSTRDSFRARWAEKRGSRDLVVSSSEMLEELQPSAEASPEERLLLREARKAMLELCRRAAGGRKRERNFRVLALAFLDGLTTREIADRFSGRLSRTCIDSLVYRARRRLLKEGVILGSRGALA